MTKATLEFDLSDIDEERSFTRIVKSHNAYRSLDDIREYLRSLYKYSELSAIEMQIIEKIRNQYYEILEKNDLTDGDL